MRYLHWYAENKKRFQQAFEVVHSNVRIPESVREKVLIVPSLHLLGSDF